MRNEVCSEPATQAYCGEIDAPKSADKIREISISELNYGYIVRVGCHSFAIESSEKLLQALNEYIKSPSLTEEKWYKNEFILKKDK